MWIDPIYGDRYQFQGKNIIDSTNTYEYYELKADSGKWQMYMKVSEKWILNEKSNNEK